MGAADQVIYQYLSDNDRFSDLINGYLGEQILETCDLTEQDTQTAVGKRRDIIRKAAMGMEFVLIGVENQSAVHYAMPIRTMTYDALSYDAQLKQIRKKNKHRKRQSGAEFLSGFCKQDKVIPVFTLVVYYGHEPWDGALDLYGVMELGSIPRSVKKLVHNYPVNLLEVNSFEDVERFRTDLSAVFGFLQNCQDRQALQAFMNQHQADYKALNEDAYDVITYLAGEQELAKYKNKFITKGGYDMCQAIQEMVAEGKNQGISQGKKEGIEKGIEKGIERGIEKGIEKGIERGMKVGEDRILQLVTMMSEDNRGDQIVQLAMDKKFLQEMLMYYNV